MIREREGVVAQPPPAVIASDEKAPAGGGWATLDLGVDVGSVSAKVVVMDREGNILVDVYRRVHGRPIETTHALLDELSKKYGSRIDRIAFTGTGGRLMAGELGALFVNEIVAQSRAEAQYYPAVRTIIEIGGEDSKLILLKEEDGRTVVDDFAMNSICAAGTGSFLDQQANRLGVNIEGEFGALAVKSATPPRIAGRCTVFAKSDMIHLQQKATPVWDIIAGLCFALARNFKGNLGRGRQFEKPIAFQGGVAFNEGVVRAFTEILELAPGELIIPEHRASMGAIGAVLQLRDMVGQTFLSANIAGKNACAPDGSQFKGTGPLVAFLTRSKPRDRRLARLPRYDRREPATRDLSTLRDGEKLDVYLGIDVGSISTNVVALDSEKRLISKAYLMTAGRPIEAVRQGLKIVGDEIAGRVNVRGVGTTGSGRYLTGDFVGADVVRNEITAQATAAIHIDPKVDTIFEIGGQDSKYISIDNGVVVDFQMNHVCAAGTGSFLEEQAEKLGISIKDEFGKLSLSSESPVKLGERCTVFMESDLVLQQQSGARTDELVAGLCYSIVYNYLNRVVGTRRIGNRIFFQGGVAFNDGVVSAFRQVTGKDIIVPPHHEVTGAIGAAILALGHQRAKDADHRSAFRGFDLSSRKYELRRFECADCSNACEINEVIIEGEDPLFYGSRCDKYNLRKKEKKAGPRRDLFKRREELLMECTKTASTVKPTRGRCGIPRALIQHETLPFWWTFSAELGYEPVLSPKTNHRIIMRGVEAVATETCFPVKVAHGHVLELIDAGVDAILLPSQINSEPEFDGQDNACFCPYVQSSPYVIRAAIDIPKSIDVLIFPVQFQFGKAHVVDAITRECRKFGWKKPQVRRALEAAMRAQAAFRRCCREEGAKALAELGPEDRPTAIVARPYNGCDMGVNIDLPRKLADLGMTAVPLDFLPLDEVDLTAEWENMFWKYGQKIMAAAACVRQNPLLTAVYITNFSCGPDSFLTTFFRKALGDKPGLLLEIDEHSADAGIITRIEAFLDSLSGAEHRRVSTPELAPRNASRSNGRLIYIPHMCEHAHMLAAAFRCCGIDAQALPDSDETSLELGRRYTTGKECLPAIVTAGDMLKMVYSPGFDRNRAAFFMPGGTGPCRFGQYNRLHRYILKEIGYEDVPVISPSQGRSFYEDFKQMEKDPTRLGWQGIVAADLLVKALHRIRPYEDKPGSTDEVFAACLRKLEDDLSAGKDVWESAFACVREMSAVKVHDCGTGGGTPPMARKPRVGIVGEIYVRSHAFSNANVVRTLESMGAEVELTGFIEWIYYTNFSRLRRARRERNFVGAVKQIVIGWVQRMDERRIASLFRDILEEPVEPPSEIAINFARPYLHDSFEGEAVLSIGKTIEYFHRHTSGVVNVMPFTCMPGSVVTALLKRVREDHDQLPVVSLSYDGQNEGGTVTRLEAFMHQVKEYHRRRSRSTLYFPLSSVVPVFPPADKLPQRRKVESRK